MLYSLLSSVIEFGSMSCWWKRKMTSLCCAIVNYFLDQGWGQFDSHFIIARPTSRGHVTNFSKKWLQSLKAGRHSSKTWVLMCLVIVSVVVYQLHEVHNVRDVNWALCIEWTKSKQMKNEHKQIEMSHGSLTMRKIHKPAKKYANGHAIKISRISQRSE